VSSIAAKVGATLCVLTALSLNLFRPRNTRNAYWQQQGTQTSKTTHRNYNRSNDNHDVNKSNINKQQTINNNKQQTQAEKQRNKERTINQSNKQ
jgi:hypothetical protein